MWGAIIGLIKPLLGTVNDVTRNRLLNRHTPTGVTLFISAAVGLGYMTEPTANFIITLLSRGDIDMLDIYLNIWIFAGNVAFIYIGYRGVKLIVRLSDCYFEDKILKKYDRHNNNDSNKNNMSCIKY